ncbi:carboxypeptidase-like regulatory domain-containing protein [Mariniflexile sp.]|uniref:carboxypeptidase-like regulatory domain-containing protein n=1 Tax=Mariniflexile sp. TaxID=1979402 RepID=UPI00356B2108
MKTKYLALFIVFMGHRIIYSQNITAKLIDKNTQKPIPYATIKTGEYNGVISNEEGYFSLIGENPETTLLNISCLGYKNITLSIKDLKKANYLIKLEEAFNQLNEIYITNQRPNVDTIIAGIKKKFKDNYDVNLKTYSIFYRATDYIDFKNLNFEIDKASQVSKQQLEQANARLEALNRDIINSKTIHFTDFKGNVYLQNRDNTKLAVTKVTKLIDQKNDFSLKEVEKRAQHIILKYLDTTKTYKMKSGIFTVEDSMSLRKENLKNNSKKEIEITDLKNNTDKLIHKTQLYENSFLYNILDTKLYDHTITDVTFFNDEVNYIINYKPRKGKAKYTGNLLVSGNNYAITKLDFSYFEDRHGSKLNLKLLVGIKFEENINKGTILFEKQENNKYLPKYIKHETGNYFYVKRDLTLIENSRNRYKISSEFKIEGNNRHKEELLFTAINTLNLDDYKAIKQEKSTTFQNLNKYEKSIWENEEILEPLEEMKKFNN